MVILEHAPALRRFFSREQVVEVLILVRFFRCLFVLGDPNRFGYGLPSD